MSTENRNFTYDTDKDLIKVIAKLVNTSTNEVLDSQDVTLDIPDPPPNTITLTHTEPVRRFRQESTDFNTTEVFFEEDITIEFTFGYSGSAPRTGQFLDGTWWVEHTGNITLIGVTPTSETIKGDAEQWINVDIDINNTVINPDFGVTYFNSETQRFGKYKHSTDDLVVDVDQRKTVTPIDTRLASDLDPSGSFQNVSPPLSGIYDANQKWDGNPVSLHPGDTVLKVVSISDTVNDGGVDKLTYGHGSSKAMCVATMTTLEVLTTSQVNSQLSTPTFRPPLVWDPRDRDNRPFFTEADLSSVEFNATSLGDLQGLFGDTIASSSINTEGPQTQAGFDSLKARFFDAGHKSPIMIYNGGMTKQEKGPDPSLYLNAQHSQAGLGIEARYSSNIAYGMEALSAFVFDTSKDEDDRKEVRRIFAQRGIDIYGSVYSCGNPVYATGGWGQHITPALIWAHLVTQSDLIKSVLDYNIGNDFAPTMIVPDDGDGLPIDHRTFRVGFGDIETELAGGSSRAFDRRGRRFSGAGKFSTYRRFNVPVLDTETITKSSGSSSTDYTALVLGNLPSTDRLSYGPFMDSDADTLEDPYDRFNGVIPSAAEARENWLINAKDAIINSQVADTSTRIKVIRDDDGNVTERILQVDKNKKKYEVIVRDNSDELHITSLDGCAVKVNDEVLRVIMTRVVKNESNFPFATDGDPGYTEGNPGTGLDSHDGLYKIYLSGAVDGNPTEIDISGHLNYDATSDSDVDFIDSIGDTHYKESSRSGFVAYGYNSLSNPFLYFLCKKLFGSNLPKETEFRYDKMVEVYGDTPNIQRLNWSNLNEKYILSTSKTNDTHDWYLALTKHLYEQINGVGSAGTAISVQNIKTNDEYLSDEAYTNLVDKWATYDVDKEWPVRPPMPWSGGTVKYVVDRGAYTVGGSGYNLIDVDTGDRADGDDSKTSGLGFNLFDRQLYNAPGGGGVAGCFLSTEFLLSVGDYNGTGKYEEFIRDAINPKMAFFPIGADEPTIIYDWDNTFNGSGFNSKDRMIWTSDKLLHQGMEGHFPNIADRVNMGSFIIYDQGSI